MLSHYLNFLNNVAPYAPLHVVKFNLNHEIVSLYFTWNGDQDPVPSRGPEQLIFLTKDNT